MGREGLKSRQQTVFGQSYDDTADDDSNHHTLIQDIADVADFLKKFT